MICPYCNTAFIVERAKQQFNNTFVSIDNVNIDKLYIQNISNDFVIEGGTLIKYQGIATKCKIPDTVYSIGRRAFANTMIEAVEFPQNLCKIEENAFWGCSNLKKIILHASVSQIASSAFGGLTELREFDISKCNVDYNILELWRSKKLQKLSISTYTYEYLKKDKISYGNLINELPFQAVDNIFISGEKIDKDVFVKEIKKIEWRKMGVCQYCGGKFTDTLLGFSRVCEKCKRKKDY